MSVDEQLTGLPTPDRDGRRRLRDRLNDLLVPPAGEDGRPPAAPHTAVSVLDRPEAPPGWRTGLAASGLGPRVAVAVLVLGVLTRFLPAGPLWFDEAQSVGIARLPVMQLFAALRQDGSPPLYYLLLHGWMLLVGRSAFAVRALSGLTSVATIPVFERLARRVLPERARWPAILLLASSPFAIRFADEARMYSLVVLVVALGSLALLRALERTSTPRLVLVSLASGALALTHYWGLFLLAALGIGLAWRARRRDVAARRVLLALLGGGILFAPWVPSLLFQIQHTGTPWQHAGPFDSTVALAAWAGAMGAGPALYAAVPLVPLLLGLVAAGSLRTTAARRLTWLALGGVALAGFTSFLLGAAVVPRYTSIGLVPYLAAAAAGVVALRPPWGRRALAAAIALGLVAGTLDATAPRTLAGKAAALLRRDGSPADTVVYCPDQLGPDVSRLLPHWYLQEMYPTGAFPDRVDWVNYAARNWLSSPTLFARRASAMAGNQPVWLLEANDFASYFGQCGRLVHAFAELRPQSVTYSLGADPMSAREHELLIEYKPAP